MKAIALDLASVDIESVRRWALIYAQTLEDFEQLVVELEQVGRSLKVIEKQKIQEAVELAESGLKLWVTAA